MAAGLRHGWVLFGGLALLVGAVGLARLLPQALPPLALLGFGLAWLHHRRRWRERLLSHTAGLLLTPRRL